MTAPDVFRVPDDGRAVIVYRCRSCGAWSPHELWHRDRCPTCGAALDEVSTERGGDHTDGR